MFRPMKRMECLQRNKNTEQISHREIFQCSSDELIIKSLRNSRERTEFYNNICYHHVCTQNAMERCLALLLNGTIMST